MRTVVSRIEFLAEICNRKIYRLVAALVDLLSLIVAWEAAVRLRAMLNPWMRLSMTVHQIQLLTPPFAWIVGIWVSASLLVYQRRTTDESIGAHFIKILQVWAFASTLTLMSTLASRKIGEDLSRSFAILYPVCSLCTLLIGRYVALLATAEMQRRYMAPEHVGVVGDGPEVLTLIRQIGQRSESVVRVAGILRPARAAAGHASTYYPVPVLGTTHELASVINRERISRLIISGSQLDQGEVESCTKLATQMGVRISHSVSPVNEWGRFQFTQLCGVQLLELTASPFTRKAQIIKRVFDFAAASAALVMLLPVFVAVAILIKLTSAGPILYKASRVGKGGRHFTFLKFRSMYVAQGGHSEERAKNRSGHLFKVKHDRRITRIGKFLRRYSLDELPQFVNVIMGDMSLVGPRPLPAEDLDPDGQSSLFRSWSSGRSTVPPGITGLWQVRGRSDTGFEEMMRLDAEYLNQWSLTLDFKILLETPLAVLSSRGAY